MGFLERGECVFHLSENLVKIIILRSLLGLRFAGVIFGICEGGYINSLEDFGGEVWILSDLSETGDFVLRNSLIFGLKS